MPNIIFKVKSGPTIGFGHVARSRVLINTLKSKFGVGAKLLINRDGEPKADICVLDYPGAKRADASYERVVLMQELLAKTKLTIIADSIIEARHNRVSENIDRILITMGGAYPYELTLQICQYLVKIKLKDVIVNAIVGTYFSKNQVKELNQLKRRGVIKLNLHTGVKNLNKFIKQSDLAITAGGVTMHECATACLPALIVCHWPISEMRKFNSFLKKGTGLSLGHYTKLTYTKFAKEFNSILNLKTREHVFENCKKFDGLDDKIKLAKLILNA